MVELPPWENMRKSFAFIPIFIPVYIYNYIYIYVYIHIIPTRNHVHSCLIILGGRGSVSFWRPFLENTESLPQTWGPKQPEFLWQMSNVCPVPKLWSLSGILFSKRDAYGKEKCISETTKQLTKLLAGYRSTLALFFPPAGWLFKHSWFLQNPLHVALRKLNKKLQLRYRLMVYGLVVEPYPSEIGVKVSDDEIPNMMGKSFEMPWFQSPPSSF